jgi:integrase/recombinase XerD
MATNPNLTIVPRNAALARSTKILPYLPPEEIARMENAAARAPRKGDRDALLIAVLFQVGLRASEVIRITPNHLELFEGKPVIRVLVKGHKQHVMSVPEPLAHRLQAYAFRHGLSKTDRFFKMNRQRVWQIVKRAAQDAGIDKRVYPHLLRHSDAIERARQLRHPKALQEHFGWSSPYMVMRYLSTLQQEDALRINQEVRFD